MKGTVVSAFNLAGIAVGLLAVLLLCLGVSDPWFFSLLALACLCGAMGEAYREDKPGAIAFLLGAAAFGFTSLGAAFLARARGPR